MSDIKKKTLADLKRDAASGKIAFELIERYGKTGNELPERLRGIRLVQSVASLIEYTEDTLTVYSAGERSLTDEERALYR